MLVRHGSDRPEVLPASVERKTRQPCPHAPAARRGRRRSPSTPLHPLTLLPSNLNPNLQVFEGGALFDPAVLDIKDEDLMKSVSAAIANVAAASLELGHPTLASIPHMVVAGYKNVLAVAVATDYDFPLAEKARGSGC